MISLLLFDRDDEILVSVLGRYGSLLHYPDSRSVLEDAFDNRSVKAIIDFPNNLYTISPPWLEHEEFVSFLIENNTLLPLYRPFFTQKRFANIRSAMIYGTEGDIRLQLGLLSSSITGHQYVPVCNKCIEADLLKYGNTHVRRTHIARGSYFCAIHKVPLQYTNLSSTNNAKLADINEYLHCLSPIELPSTHEHGSDYLYLSEQIHELLNNSTRLTDATYLRERYIVLLANRGLATHTGQLRVDNLNQEFSRRFKSDFLTFLGCEIDSAPKRNWLIRMLQSEQLQPPIRHLLLMRFLDVTFVQFSDVSVQNYPFGLSPYPCLNQICEHYMDEVIAKPRIGYSPNTHRAPLGTFKCPYCGFTYSRVGPDTEDDRYRIGRVVTRGEKWLYLLKKLWKAGHTKKDIAENLHVHVETVTRQLARSNLIECPKWLTLKVDKNASRFRELDLARAKEDWLQILKNHPTLLLNDLIKKFGQLYWTLYRLDATWLKSNSPRPQRKGKKVIPERVNWKLRDLLIFKDTPEAVSRILEYEKPRKISYNSVARELGLYESYLTKNSEKLPFSRFLLSLVVETDEDFAIRRIKLAMRQFGSTGKNPTQAALIKKAGISKSMQTEMIMSLIRRLTESST